MPWLFGQTWLWYLIAFLVGVLLAWLLFVRPQQSRLRALEPGGSEPVPAADPGATRAIPTAAVATGAAAGAVTAVIARDDSPPTEEIPVVAPRVDEAVTEQLPAVDPALSTLDAATLTGADGAHGPSDPPTTEIPAVAALDGSPSTEPVEAQPVAGDNAAAGSPPADTPDAPSGGERAAAGAAALGVAAAGTAPAGAGTTDEPAAQAADGQAVAEQDAAGGDATAGPSEAAPAADTASAEDTSSDAEGPPAATRMTEDSPAEPAAAATGTAATPTPQPDTAPADASSNAAVGAAGVGAGALGAAAVAGGSEPDGAPFGPGSARPTTDGSSPGAEYAIKGHAGSMRYHAADSPFYSRTRADVWFRAGSDAEAAGFTAGHRNRGAVASPPTPVAPQGLLVAPAAAAAVVAGRWSGSALPQADGSAPSDEYTIKGNADSMLYHTPASPYYGRTKAEAWFSSTEDAEAAGFTAWRRK